MHKLYSTSKIWVFILISLAFASCAPKYGQHFAQSSYSPYAKAPDKVRLHSNSLLPQLAAQPGLATTVASVDPANQPRLAHSVLATEISQNTPTQISSRQQQKMVLRQLRAQLKNMNTAERAALQNQLQAGLEAYKASPPPPPGSGASNLDPILLVIITVLLPPLGVFLYEGDITNRFWISLLLTLLFYIPGLVYSMLVIFGEI